MRTPTITNSGYKLDGASVSCVGGNRVDGIIQDELPSKEIPYIVGGVECSNNAKGIWVYWSKYNGEERWTDWDAVSGYGGRVSCSVTLTCQ